MHLEGDRRSGVVLTGSVRSHGSWKSEGLAFDLLEFACLHEADFATFRLTSVAIHLSQLLEVKYASHETLAPDEMPAKNPIHQ